jgi:hypothetical protein
LCYHRAENNRLSAPNYHFKVYRMVIGQCARVTDGPVQYGLIGGCGKCPGQRAQGAGILCGTLSDNTRKTKKRCCKRVRIIPKVQIEVENPEIKRPAAIKVGNRQSP